MMGCYSKTCAQLIVVILFIGCRPYQVVRDGEGARIINYVNLADFDGPIAPEDMEAANRSLLEIIRHPGGTKDQLEILLKHGADPDYQYRVRGYSFYPLIEVGNLDFMDKRSIEFARILLAHGANVNIANDRKETALFMASFRLHTSLVKLLLDSGADPNVQTNGPFHQTPLMAAIQKGYNPDSVSRTLVMQMAPSIIVQLLLEKGANVNAKTPDGETALDKARSLGFKNSDPIIQVLLKAGAISGSK